MKNILKNIDVQLKKILAIMLILIGASMIVYPIFNSSVSKKGVESGIIKISNEKIHSIHWPAILGAILLVAGVIVIVRDKKVSI